MNRVDMTVFGLLNQYELSEAEYMSGYKIGRILSQEKGMYRIISENGEQTAEISGKFYHTAKSISDFPAAGDFVIISCGDSQSRATIHRVLPRKSVFIRRAAGKAREEQIVAANIDTVFICMSLNNDFNIRRLERYLSVAWDSGAVPVIVLTKSDLCSDTERFLYSVKSAAVGMDIIMTSAMEQDGYRKLLPYIGEGKTAAFIGSSGVGKSTLINQLLGENRLNTNGLRNDDKGRHTTTRRELFLLKQGGMVIDTPGMRELGLLDIEDGLGKSFSDIEELAEMCRFKDCTHTAEPDCAVRRAVSEGKLSEGRLQSYHKLKAENKYFENTEEYMAEKKRKFKKIAEINKENRLNNSRR